MGAKTDKDSPGDPDFRQYEHQPVPETATDHRPEKCDEAQTSTQAAPVNRSLLMREPPDPLRVLMVTPHSPIEQGGVEQHVMEVSRRLVAAGVSVEVLCGNPGGPKVSEQRQDGVLIRSVRAWPTNRDYYLAPGMWRQMGRDDWDVVHVQSYHTFVAPLAMLRALSLGIPYVVTFHGGGHSSRLRHQLRRPQRRLLRPLLARSARLVAVARFEIEQYGDALRLPRESFALIRNGSDITVSENSVGSGDPDNDVLASVGRLERYKGHHRVVAAIPYVLRDRPNAKLLIVGVGPYESALRRQVAKLGIERHVEFVSIPPRDRPAMGDLLRRVRLLVLLSDFESGSIAAIEAAAAGCRLLVADRAGLRELAEDGLARAIDPEDQPEKVGSAIVEELRQPREPRAVHLTSWADCAAALLDLYRAILKQSRNPDPDRAAETAHS
jgi:glycosyltransferase involved in cell wall biosynthesis